jgi:hypothetical protein
MSSNWLWRKSLRNYGSTPLAAFRNNPAARNASRRRVASLYNSNRREREKVKALQASIMKHRPNLVEQAQAELNAQEQNGLTPLPPTPQPVSATSNRALAAAQVPLPRNQNNVVAAQRKAAREQPNIWNMPGSLVPSVVQQVEANANAGERQAALLNAQAAQRIAAQAGNNVLGNNPLQFSNVVDQPTVRNSRRLANNAKRQMRSKKNLNAFVSPVGLYGNDAFVENIGSNQNIIMSNRGTTASVFNTPGSLNVAALGNSRASNNAKRAARAAVTPNVFNTPGSLNLAALGNSRASNNAKRAARAAVTPSVFNTPGSLNVAAFGSSDFPSAANVDAANAGVNAAAAEAARAAASAAKLRAEQEERALARARLRAPEIPAIVQNPFGGPNPFGSAPKTNNAAAEAAAAAAAAAVHAANVAALQYNAGSTNLKLPLNQQLARLNTRKNLASSTNFKYELGATNPSLGCTPCEAEILSKLDTLLDRSKPSNVLGALKGTGAWVVTQVAAALSDAEAALKLAQEKGSKVAKSVAKKALEYANKKLEQLQKATTLSDETKLKIKMALIKIKDALGMLAKTTGLIIGGTTLVAVILAVGSAAAIIGGLSLAGSKAFNYLKTVAVPAATASWSSAKTKILAGLGLAASWMNSTRKAVGRRLYNFGTRVSGAAAAAYAAAGRGAGAVSRAMYRLSGREQADMIKQLVQQVTSLELQGRITSKALEELNAALAAAKPGVVTADVAAEAAKVGADRLLANAAAASSPANASSLPRLANAAPTATSSNGCSPYARMPRSELGALVIRLGRHQNNSPNARAEFIKARNCWKKDKTNGGKRSRKNRRGSRKNRKASRKSSRRNRH